MQFFGVSVGFRKAKTKKHRRGTQIYFMVCKFFRDRLLLKAIFSYFVEAAEKSGEACSEQSNTKTSQHETKC